MPRGRPLDGLRRLVAESAWNESIRKHGSINLVAGRMSSMRLRCVAPRDRPPDIHGAPRCRAQPRSCHRVPRPSPLGFHDVGLLNGSHRSTSLLPPPLSRLPWMSHDARLLLRTFSRQPRTHRLVPVAGNPTCCQASSAVAEQTRGVLSPRSTPGNALAPCAADRPPKRPVVPKPSPRTSTGMLPSSPS